jgi:hypothetical protein
MRMPHARTTNAPRRWTGIGVGAAYATIANYAAKLTARIRMSTIDAERKYVLLQAAQIVFEGRRSVRPRPVGGTLRHS